MESNRWKGENPVLERLGEGVSAKAFSLNLPKSGPARLSSLLTYLPLSIFFGFFNVFALQSCPEFLTGNMIKAFC